MKQLLSTLLIATCISCLGQNNISVKEAKDLLDKWNQAYYDKDTSALNQVLHKNYFYSGNDGEMVSKTEVMNELITSDYSIVNTQFNDLDIQTYDETAIIRGWEELTLILANGEKEKLRLRFIDIYIKQKGKVRAIATQTFPID